ncbi:MAG: flagellar hook assembly protein FlgD, partial [Thalassobaculaceae bacterium]
QMPGNASMLEDGGARFGYSLAETAQSVKLTVLDSSGKAVFETDGLTTAGRHDFTWDGKDGDGNTMEPGVYSLVVTARDKDGDPIVAETDARATVTGVVTGNDGPELMVGDLSVKLIDVDKIFAADAA